MKQLWAYETSWIDVWAPCFTLTVEYWRVLQIVCVFRKQLTLKMNNHFLILKIQQLERTHFVPTYTFLSCDEVRNTIHFCIYTSTMYQECIILHLVEVKRSIPVLRELQSYTEKHRE